MRATAILHDRGQSLWLDNLTRRMLDSGQLARYIDEQSVTGLTSNPSIFDAAIQSGDYDETIRRLAGRGLGGDDLFFELAIEDLRRAADLFLPIYERTDGVDGWVSLELSPLLVRDAKRSIAVARDLHDRAGRPNLFIKIPGTAEGRTAIEETVAAGVPVNVTLLFSADQYRGAAEAYMRGIERRIQAGLSPRVASVASVFMSRWDKAANPRLPDALKNRLGLAVGRQAYREYRQLMNSERWQRLANGGARVQRLLFASTSAKEPGMPDTFYVAGLFAPFTIDTMPDKTLAAFHQGGQVGEPLPPDGGDCEPELARIGAAGIDVAALAAQLQDEGGEAFSKSWHHMLEQIDTRIGQAQGAGQSPSAGGLA